MSGKYALIIGNTEYTDPGLAQLTAPGKDADDFARVLKDKEICSFDDVKVLLNQLSSSIIEAIDEFFDQKKPDDLLVLYYSGHGVRDEIGSLYLASRNTVRTRLRSTAIKSDYIREAMDQSRSKRQVVILDCCNSGAFPQGTKAEVGGAMGMAKALQGYGRFVLTASDATQFAWEGNRVIGETENSLFTHFLVKGLEGEADKDGDGKISVDELYDFAFEQISKLTPKQTPTKSTSKQEGEIVLRHIMRIEDIKPMPLPNDLLNEVDDTRPYVREAAVYKLEKILKSKNIAMARSAMAALEKIIVDENTTPRVAKSATQALESFHLALTEDVIEKERSGVKQTSQDHTTKFKTKTEDLDKQIQHVQEKPEVGSVENKRNGQIVKENVEPGTPFGKKLDYEEKNKAVAQQTKRSRSLLFPIGMAGILLVAVCASGIAAIRYFSQKLTASPPITASASTPDQQLHTPTLQPVTAMPSATSQVLLPVTAFCSELLTPKNDTEVVAYGKIVFSWKPVSDAASYTLELTLPNGSMVPFKTKNTELTRYAESTPVGGDYRWKVTAYKENGDLICTTELFRYTKPNYVVVPREGPGDSPGGNASPTCTPPTGCSFGYDPNTCTCL